MITFCSHQSRISMASKWVSFAEYVRRNLSKPTNKMLGPVRRMSKDVITIVVHSLTVTHHTSHQAVKRGWCVCESKRHDSETKEFFCQMTVVRDLHLEAATFTEAIYGKRSDFRLTSQRFPLLLAYWFGVEDCDTIQFSVVDAYSSTPIWFLYHEDRWSIGSRRLFNYSHSYHAVDFSFKCLWQGKWQMICPSFDRFTIRVVRVFVVSPPGSPNCHELVVVTPIRYK